MKTKHNTVATLAAILITIGSLAGGANGAIVLNIYQNGAKVSMSTVGGTVNTTGLTLSSFSGLPNNILHGVQGVVGFQQSDDSLPLFSGGSFSSSGGFNFGNGGVTSATFMGAYNMIALQQNVSAGENLYLGTGAISGVNIVSAVTATTVADTTLAGLGFVENSSLTYTWGADSVTIVVTSVPEPSSALLLALGALGLVSRRKRIP